MPDPNKSWTDKEKKDFESGMAKSPDYWGNLKRGLGLSTEPSPVTKRLYDNQKKPQVPVRGPVR